MIKWLAKAGVGEIKSRVIGWQDLFKIWIEILKVGISPEIQTSPRHCKSRVELAERSLERRLTYIEGRFAFDANLSSLGALWVGPFA